MESQILKRNLKIALSINVVSFVYLDGSVFVGLRSLTIDAQSRPTS